MYLRIIYNLTVMIFEQLHRFIRIQQNEKTFRHNVKVFGYLLVWTISPQ
jgi:hypothetical protein